MLQGLLLSVRACGDRHLANQIRLLSYTQQSGVQNQAAWFRMQLQYELGAVPAAIDQARHGFDEGEPASHPHTSAHKNGPLLDQSIAEVGASEGVWTMN